MSVGVCNVFKPVVKCDEMHHYLSRDFFSFSFFILKYQGSMYELDVYFI